MARKMTKKQIKQNKASKVISEQMHKGKSREQAIAIGLSVAGLSKKKSK